MKEPDELDGDQFPDETVVLRKDELPKPWRRFSPTQPPHCCIRQLAVNIKVHAQ